MVCVMDKQREMNVKLAKLILENPMLKIVYAIHGEDDDIWNAIGEDLHKELEIEDVFVGKVASIDYIDKYGDKAERLMILDEFYASRDCKDFWDVIRRDEGCTHDSERIDRIFESSGKETIIVLLRGV